MENTETNPVETPIFIPLTPEEEELMWFYYEEEKAKELAWYNMVVE